MNIKTMYKYIDKHPELCNFAAQTDEAGRPLTTRMYLRLFKKEYKDIKARVRAQEKETKNENT